MNILGEGQEIEKKYTKAVELHFLIFQAEEAEFIRDYWHPVWNSGNVTTHIEMGKKKYSFRLVKENEPQIAYMSSILPLGP